MSSNVLVTDSRYETDRHGVGVESGLGVAVLEMPAHRRDVPQRREAMAQAPPASSGRLDKAEVSLRVLVSDLIQLTKPRIVVMILVTTVATAMIAAGGLVSLGQLALLLLGTGMVAGSAGGANQIWERVIDRNMPRTAVRPLPAARMSTAVATAFTASMGTLGLAILWMGFSIVPAAVGLATWLLYVFLYTPMKTRTSWNTTVGAIAGALPMLIGYTALGGSLADGTGWLLFGVLAAWQYPHFMAIAWLYRRQYEQAGFCMSTTVEPTGISAAVQSIVGSLSVIGCGVALCWLAPGMVPAVIGSFAVLLATVPMLKASLRFARDRNDVTARRLLRSSLLVLPAVLAVVTIRVFW
ncbi:Protoheme IX farnesyltransferase [Stieleria maiorica]|uniref:Protoheme IX farnesyltransferase n=1 Tax=Stieleria maiorica TaxID=2795974 RepID=A0A5B9MPX5_9BACT|nr:protoheme IX farnesyltransferase [Stieleria maiorica]QEG02057.1 Protoheme IX farnesyltransferase [Stieleria maiorica]